MFKGSANIYFGQEGIFSKFLTPFMMWSMVGKVKRKGVPKYESEFTGSFTEFLSGQLRSTITLLLSKLDLSLVKKEMYEV